ncbi:Sulfotransferase family protein [Salinibacillus kushneri]|uniref:Sulfotransferase family protein n=1 Tax=Salinibacillus kushneri TaxID=237682 RepID=A0A1H9YSE0_9BACI|nr:sulfotransferase [Salinibacillus kushneri]SES71567.1 Sulfotransferase family protein [Salinibacillus kushneri]
MDMFSPMFIGGAGRSGTTLLVDLIGLHPNISPVYELIL